jgi:predicted nucleic acid-binding protein
MLLVDSNIWLDAADVDCPTYKACAGLLRDRQRELVTPAVVVSEAARLIRFKLEGLARIPSH